MSNCSFLLIFIKTSPIDKIMLISFQAWSIKWKFYDKILQNFVFYVSIFIISFVKVGELYVPNSSKMYLKFEIKGERILMQNSKLKSWNYIQFILSNCWELFKEVCRTANLIFGFCSFLAPCQLVQKV